MKSNFSRNMQIGSCLLLMVMLLALTTEVAGNRRVTYGQACNRTSRCDSRASLTCKAGICTCIMADTMRYDARYARCSVLAGEKCIFTAVESESKIEARSWREEMPCIHNAQCQDGFCTCFAGFFETTNGTCEIKRGHREDCETSTACRDDQNLICTDTNVCDCNSAVSTYDFGRQMCVTKAGAPCVDLQFCVSHAYCRDPLSAADVVCECEEGYFANAEGACERKRGYGETCLGDNYCTNDVYNTRLLCNPDGRCGCNANTSIFDASSNMCRRLAGVLCHDFPYCVENSECGRSRYYERETEVECECNTGYFETNNGTCELQRVYGGSCEQNGHCQPGLICDAEKGLCQCDITRSVYDTVKGKCVGLANSLCEDNQDCVTNSECLWAGEDTRRCTCQTGYAPSTNGSCLASHGMWCSEQWTYACNSELGLICREGKCACKYERLQSFDPEFKKCVSSASGPCDKNIPCVPNSHCADDKIGKHPSKRCKCNRGFVEVDGECQLTIGQRCNYTQIRNLENTLKIKCDTYASLYCIEGVCQCDSLQAYDRDAMKCKGQVGAACDENDGLFCIEGASCDHRRFVSNPSKGICKCQEGWMSTGSGHCVKANNVTGSAIAIIDEEMFV